jgi:hypothetical protein
MSSSKSINTAGGLAKLWFLPLQHYKGLGYNWAKGMAAIVANAELLQPIYFTPDTGGYEVTWKKGAYQLKLKAKLPGNETAMDATLSRLEVEPFLLVALNHNGQYLLFGDYDNYFLYERDQDTGEDFIDLSHFKIDITRQLMTPPRLIVSPF